MDNTSIEDDKVPEPVASLNAILDPKPLTIAQIALLERVNSPVVSGRIDNVNDCLLALYLLSMPIREAGKLTRENSADVLKDMAVEWSDENIVDGRTYNDRLSELLVACTEFWRMLPRPEEKDAKKKDTATAG